MEETINIEVLFGYVELRSWIEVQGDKFVGMGSKIVHDGDGNITEVKIEPTGLIGFLS